MDTTRLVQRLEAPVDDRDVFGDNPYISTAGVLNWGLNDEGMRILKGLVQFQYMGASEFEWGAIPNGLQKISDHALAGELMGFNMSIPLREVERTFFDEDNEPPEGDGVVWVICRKEDVEEVSRRIRAWALNDADRFGTHDSDPEWCLCESTRLNAALRPNPSWPSKIIGWVELDNGFFFFTSEKMFNDISKLFGLVSISESQEKHGL